MHNHLPVTGSLDGSFFGTAALEEDIRVASRVEQQIVARLEVLSRQVYTGIVRRFSCA